ncbi:TT1751-like protein [Mycena venus]|uniref:TT1751-like protein n=1 Tax=Mycena venus TaxID=2733690 RepID=A0A8H6Y5N2_9AGAR|nr:TT1751-like protein [Mycena venus]
MAKTVTSHNLQIVTFSTTLQFSEVTSRLDKQIGKGEALMLPGFKGGVTSKEDLQAHVSSMIGPSGFRYFNEFNHGAWLRLYNSSTPRVVVYVLGNPVIAQTMLQYDLRGAVNIPPRLLVLEKADDAGTDVVYHLPSSVIALSDNEKLRAAAEALDSKLEALVESITAVEKPAL